VDYFIAALNVICLIGLVAGLRSSQKKHGKMPEKRLALIIIAYFSFFIVTTFSPLLVTHPKETIMVDTILLLILWGIGFPWTLWLIRKARSLN